MDFEYEGGLKMIEDLDMWGELGGFNQNQIRGIYRGFI